MKGRPAYRSYLFLGGDVNVAVAQVEEKVPVNLLSYGDACCLAVYVRLSGHVDLDRIHHIFI